MSNGAVTVVGVSRASHPGSGCGQWLSPLLLAPGAVGASGSDLDPELSLNWLLPRVDQDALCTTISQILKEKERSRLHPT